MNSETERAEAFTPTQPSPIKGEGFESASHSATSAIGQSARCSAVRGRRMMTVVPSPERRLELDRAAMGLDELLGERQAEPDRRLLAAPPLGGAAEPVEHPRLIGRGDAAAIVGDDDPRLVAVALGAEQDAAARCRYS